MRRTDPNPRYAKLAAKALARRAEEDASAGTGALLDRTGAVGAIEDALRARGRRRRTGLGWGIVAAAAAVLIVIGWQGLRAPAPTAERPVETPSDLAVTALEGDASIETQSGATAAGAGARITAGSWVRVPDSGRLVLALDSGTRLRVAASSRARVSALGALQRFDLESGSLSADVAKLPPGGRFVIGTADAEVEVRGTRFDVVVGPTASACAPFVRTRVVVHEGVVAVRFGGGEVRLAAGSTWPACAPTAAAPTAPVPARTGHARAARVQVAPAASAGTPVTAFDSSTLAEQNDLFAAALAARRRGELGEAIRWLDRLIARYPNGQLIDSARAERQRLIESGGGSAPLE